MSLQREILSPVTTAGLLLESRDNPSPAKPGVTHSGSPKEQKKSVCSGYIAMPKEWKHPPTCHCFRCHPEYRCKNPRLGWEALRNKPKEELEKINEKRKLSVKLLWQTPEYREKQLKTRKDPKQRKLHGEILGSWNKAHREEFLRNSMKGVLNSHKYPNTIEIKTEKALQKFGTFKPQQVIDKICIADFLDIKRKIVVFCDGTYWHGSPEIQERDAKINEKLRLLGYKVFRFKEEDIRNNIEACIKEIDVFLLGYHGGEKKTENSFFTTSFFQPYVLTASKHPYVNTLVGQFDYLS